MSTVGFIGLGIMGRRMCENLIEAGQDLVVFDIDDDAVKHLAAQGARAGASVAAVVAEADFLLLSLPDTPQIEQVTFGTDGIAENARPGLIVADLSTVAPETPQSICTRVADKRIAWLDAPVSGGPAGAEAGSLTIMVGGDEAAFGRIRDVLEVIGGNIEYMGGSGMGATMKIVNQLAIGIQMVAMCEALTVGVSAGIPAQRLWEVMRTSTARCWVLEDLVKNVVLENAFDTPRFAIRLISKDMRIAASTAKSLKVPAAATGVAEQVFSFAEGLGWGDQDQMAILKLYGQTKGIESW